MQESRKLNMEQKRKLEKLLIADIASATARYGAVTQASMARIGTPRTFALPY